MSYLVIIKNYLFRFYDEQNTGQLMSRLTNDLFSLTELYHHGPEDIVISIIKFIGAFILLSYINVKLTLILFAILPFMFLFAWYYNKKDEKKLLKEIKRELVISMNALKTIYQEFVLLKVLRMKIKS